MTEITADEGKKPIPLEREYQALSPEDKEAVDSVVEFYKELTRDRLTPERAKMVVDMVGGMVVNYVKQRKADEATE